MKSRYQYYKEIIKSLIEIYSNPLFRRVKNRNPSLSVFRFGDKNPDKIFYFITDMSSIGSGIFSLYINILIEISFAKTMGWIPIVDDTPMLLRRTKVSFRKNKNVMSEYFDFNNQISVQEVMESKQVIICRITDKDIYRNIPVGDNYRVNRSANFFECDSANLKYWRKFAKDNLKYKDNIQEVLEQTYGDVIGTKQRVLGVAIREGKMGMSSQGITQSGETRQPTLQETVQITKEFLKKWECEYLYLSCESDKVIEVFKSSFEEKKILYLKRVRLDYEYLVNVKSMNEGVKRGSKYPELVKHYREIDLDYLKDMYILSKCDYCIMPVNCGTEAAFVKNENLKDYYIMKG